ncbi:ATP-binding protein [Variovorax sp. LjRoot290]|uniref:AlbA family DNA-binding domain-containing protein n=1 Tax=unclassified Variovorax TaxID=663243 RepID=UPI003ED0E485
MVNNELLDALRYRSEGTDLDFKGEQYRFAGGNDFEKSEMLKAILAMANAWREGTGYILLGLKDNRPHLAEVVGISESIDSRLQQFVNSKVKPKLTFRYEEHLYEGKTVGVITLPKQKRPFFIANPYGKLKSNVAYVRRGSSTEEAEPTEVAAMALADSGRGQVLLALSVLTPDNEVLPETVALKYLNFPEKLPDFESPPERLGPFEISVRAHMWHDNRDFWREYAEYARVNAALIEMKLVLKNRSETSLSNAKLEVSVEPLDGQSFQMLAGADLPDEPSSQWSSMAGLRSLPEMLDRWEARLVVDEGGVHPICHVRFGSLLPGEEGRSSDTLAILPWKATAALPYPRRGTRRASSVRARIGNDGGIDVARCRRTR